MYQLQRDLIVFLPSINQSIFSFVCRLFGNDSFNESGFLSAAGLNDWKSSSRSKYQVDLFNIPAWRNIIENHKQEFQIKRTLTSLIQAKDLLGMLKSVDMIHFYGTRYRNKEKGRVFVRKCFCRCKPND